MSTVAVLLGLGAIGLTSVSGCTGCDSSAPAARLTVQTKGSGATPMAEVKACVGDRCGSTAYTTDASVVVLISATPDEMDTAQSKGVVVSLVDKSGRTVKSESFPRIESHRSSLEAPGGCKKPVWEASVSMSST